MGGVPLAPCPLPFPPPPYSKHTKVCTTLYTASLNLRRYASSAATVRRVMLSMSAAPGMVTGGGWRDRKYASGYY